MRSPAPSGRDVGNETGCRDKPGHHAGEMAGASTRPERALRTPSPRPDVSCLDHLAPALKLDLDALGELLGRALDLVEIERVEALLHVRQPGDIDDAAMKQGDDLVGRASRDQNADPLISGEDRIAGFRGGWNVRQLLRALLARQYERAQSPLLDMRHTGRQRADT